MTAPLKPRSLAAWAPQSTPALNLAIAKRALLDVGICEMPPGSNRSRNHSRCWANDSGSGPS